MVEGGGEGGCRFFCFLAFYLVGGLGLGCLMYCEKVWDIGVLEMLSFEMAVAWHWLGIGLF